MVTKSDGDDTATPSSYLPLLVYSQKYGSLDVNVKHKTYLVSECKVSLYLILLTSSFSGYAFEYPLELLLLSRKCLIKKHK